MPPLQISPSGRRYGYRKDVLDRRDFGLAAAPFVSATTSRVSHQDLVGAILDQGDQGCCTGHAAAKDREFLHWHELRARGEKVEPPSDGLYSPAFPYYQERVLDGSLSEGDCGSYGRTSCQALNLFGIALRKDMPYSDKDFSTAPTPEQLAAAAVWKTGGYHRLMLVSDMKACIASGFCFRIGFTVYGSFENIRSSGIWSPDPENDGTLGGHEVLASGYDDNVNGGSFEVTNSWSESWGDHGRFWLRYIDAANPRILQDSWTQHLGTWK